MKINTIKDIYAAINPLPAMLSAKGKVKPEVVLEIRANADIYISLSWVKDTAREDRDWDRNYKVMSGSADQAIEKALAFIAELPDAKTAKLHAFMAKLGAVIDDGRALGVDVDFINPLTETMKRLSENVITHKRKAVSVADASA